MSGLISPDSSLTEITLGAFGPDLLNFHPDRYPLDPEYDLNVIEGDMCVMFQLAAQNFIYDPWNDVFRKELFRTTAILSSANPDAATELYYDALARCISRHVMPYVSHVILELIQLGKHPSVDQINAYLNVKRVYFQLLDDYWLEPDTTATIADRLQVRFHEIAPQLLSASELEGPLESDSVDGGIYYHWRSNNIDPDELNYIAWVLNLNPNVLLQEKTS